VKDRITEYIAVRKLRRDRGKSEEGRAAGAILTLVGPPGTGKTSTARIFLTARGQLGTLRIDGSIQSGAGDVRNLIDHFASTMPFTPGLKIVFVDEAEYLSQNAQGNDS